MFLTKLNKSLTYVLFLTFIAGAMPAYSYAVLADTSVEQSFKGFEPIVIDGDGYSATITVADNTIATSTVQPSTDAPPMQFDINWFYSIVALMFLVIAVQGVLLFTINKNLTATRRMIRSISVNSAMGTINSLKQKRTQKSGAESKSETKAVPSEFHKSLSGESLNSVIVGLCHKDSKERLHSIRELGKIGRSTTKVRPRILTVLKAYIATLVTEQSLKETSGKEISLALRIVSGLSDGKQIDLSGLDFSNLTFDGLTLQHINFDQCSFAYATFKNTHFMGCRFEGASFNSVVLEDVQFAGCRICIKSLKEAAASSQNVNTHRADHEASAVNKQAQNYPIVDPSIDHFQMIHIANDHDSRQESRAQAIAAFKRSTKINELHLDKDKMH